MTHPVERICPECRASQPLSAHYCATCGAQIERFLPVPARQWLPARVRQQLSHPIVKGVAMGAMAIAVEVAIKVLRHALTNRGAQHISTLRSSGATPPAPTTRTVIHARRRFWQKSDAHGNVRSEEQITWQRTDQ
jgi:predicted amidophosphoribosyltransferase